MQTYYLSDYDDLISAGLTKLINEGKNITLSSNGKYLKIKPRDPEETNPEKYGLECVDVGDVLDTDVKWKLRPGQFQIDRHGNNATFYNFQSVNQTAQYVHLSSHSNGNKFTAWPVGSGNEWEVKLFQSSNNIFWEGEVSLKSRQAPPPSDPPSDDNEDFFVKCDGSEATKTLNVASAWKIEILSE